MIIAEVASFLETIAPLSLQESYDNAGFLTGDPSWECGGILCTLDTTEEVVLEAVSRKCNCIVAHHPIIFRGLKNITNTGYVRKAVIAAIKNDIAIYSVHTNVDNTITGVNGRIADRLGLTNRRVLEPRGDVLKKLFTFVPEPFFNRVREAIFNAGGGNISNYTECSFSYPGTGTFRPGEGARPFAGKVGKREEAPEIKLEVILPAYRENEILRALKDSHPYEEVAYDLIALDNVHSGTGAGLIGDMKETEAVAFLDMLRLQFGAGVVRHTPLAGKPVKRVAVCGGAGSFLITKALEAGADAFVTADLKYHEFFDAEGKMLLCDIGHFESEQFTTDLFVEILLQKFPTFAVLKSGVKTNPVNYFTGK
jgi:dinuclear metal center YbgI/SA1388 family protein